MRISAFPRRTLTALMGLLILSAGCAHFTPRPVELDREASAFEARSLHAPEVKSFIEKNLHKEISPWPPERWDFEEMTLAAVYYSPEMDVARARWGVREAGVKTAGGRPNPTVGFLTQYDAHSPAGIPPWTLGISFDIPVETANKRGYRITAASHLSEAARLDIAGAAWRVRSGLRSRLLDLYGAKMSAELLRKKLDILEETVKALEERLDSGEASAVEVTAARVALEDTRALFLKAEADVQDSRAGLAASMGLPADALDKAEFRYPFTEAGVDPPPAALRRKALTGRADMLASLEEYRATEAKLQNEIAKQYPDIHLAPGYTFDQDIDRWGIGFTVELPVFNHNEGPIAEAEAKRTEAEANLKALQARIIAAIETASAGYRAAAGKFKAAEGLLAAGKKRFGQTQSLFEAGETDRLAYLGAGLEFETLRESRLESFLDTQRFLGLMEDALQRPASEWRDAGETDKTQQAPGGR